MACQLIVGYLVPNLAFLKNVCVYIYIYIYIYISKEYFSRCLGPHWCTVFIADFGFLHIISVPTKTSTRIRNFLVPSLIALCSKLLLQFLFTYIYMIYKRVVLRYIFFVENKLIGFVLFTLRHINSIWVMNCGNLNLNETSNLILWDRKTTSKYKMDKKKKSNKSCKNNLKYFDIE